MLLLLLKIVLVPALVVVVTLGGRRWGPRVGGFLASFPIVAGPTLLFFALEQGDAFAAAAAHATLVSLLAVSLSALVYAWVSLRARWAPSLLSSWSSFLVATSALNAVRWPIWLAFVAALGSFFLVRALLPATGQAPPARPRSPWDLPLRIVSAVTVVLALTTLAGWLGPTRSGAFTAFPSALGILLAFTHAQLGAVSAIRFLHGFMPGMWSFALFCFVIALAMVPLGTWAGLALAVLALAPPQAAVLWAMRRR